MPGPAAPRAMVLAAGRGERMRPLTDACPKPLLEVGGASLIVHALRRLQAAGVREVVVNHAYLGACIEAALGDGCSLGLSIRYSPEERALETAGGIARARPLLGDDPFLLVNGDVYSDFDLGRLVRAASSLAHDDLGLIVLVPNPDHRPEGDFALEDGRVLNAGRHTLTYSGLAVLRPGIVAGIGPDERAPLGPLLRAAASDGRLAGVRFDGLWCDVGTPQRLAALDAELRAAGRPAQPDQEASSR